MPTSSVTNRRAKRSELALTAGLTAIVTLLLLAMALFVPLDTRNARGEHREMSTLDVWREMLNNLPADAPFFVNAGVLAALSILALVTSAYIIVALARLPS